VESTPGLGSLFRVHLPTCALHGDREAPPDPDHATTPSNHKANVLLVDDENEVRDALRAMLESLGFRVTACFDGREAVDQYRERWREFDAVVLDMVMPKRSGRQTFLALRDINPHARVLLISGHSVESKAQSVIDAGAAGFLQKPFSLRTLSQAMSALLDREVDPQSKV
jgi:DNA-binding NtrC family response regulator